MAIPTFNAVDLVDDSEVWVPTEARANVSTGQMPGINGAFLHDDGIGAGGHTVRGNINSDSFATAAEAIADLAAKIAVKQALKLAGVAPFVDTGGTSHTYCKLISYQVGQIEPQFDADANTWIVRRAVTVSLIDQDTAQTT